MVLDIEELKKYEKYLGSKDYYERALYNIYVQTHFGADKETLTRLAHKWIKDGKKQSSSVKSLFMTSAPREMAVAVLLILNDVSEEEIRSMSYEEKLTYIHLFGEN